jgi:putative DNA primase/helicase
MPASSVSSARPPIENFLSEMRSVAVAGNKKWKCLCPIHEWDGGQHEPSLTIEETELGRVLVYCHVCQDKEIYVKICNLLGLPIRMLNPEWGRSQTGWHNGSGYGANGRGRGKSTSPPHGSRRTAEYIYRDADGGVAYKAVRYEQPDGSKTFQQFRPNGQGGWIPNMHGVTRVPYRLPEVISCGKVKPIYIVEGEKKVEVLMEWDQIATCNVGGAGKWNKSHSEWLRGCDVVILPDDDPVDPTTGKSPGHEHARKVLESLKGIASNARILQLPGLPSKGDIVDWKAAGHTLTELLELTQRVLAEPPEDLADPDTDPNDPSLKFPLRDIRERTEKANGQRIARRFGQDIRYCSPMDKWFVWNGLKWEEDVRMFMESAAKRCIDDLWNESREIQANPDQNKRFQRDLYDKMQAFMRASDTAKATTNAVKMAASEPGLQLVPAEFDHNPWMLNCQNGTLDLETGELRPHDRGNLLTKISPVSFDPDAECPEWERFLLSVFQGDADLVGYIQRLCGYWATGIVREQILPVLWGGGSNGKTTFLNALMGVLGSDYTMKASQELLLKKYGDSHPTEKMDLFGRRLVYCSETTEGQKLDEALVKELTGKEKIRGRRMREDTWEFDPSHKIVLLTNHKPQVGSTDHGMWRRMRLIPFEAKFWNPDNGETGPEHMMRDKYQDEKLMREFPGILTWIVRGCQSWLHDGEQVPSRVLEETRKYRDAEDVVGQWIEESCETGDANLHSERAGVLYKNYKEWCERNGEYAFSQKRFGSVLTDREFKRDRDGRGAYYSGIELFGFE